MTAKKGRGVFASCDIEAGTVIGDYLGTIIPVGGSKEKENGLYDMAGGLHYDILANPKKDGIHIINHSCANNCGIYPYRGHILYFAVRKIFKGEEIAVNYDISRPDDDDPGALCTMHACYCESPICTGTMHDGRGIDAIVWEKLIKKEFGAAYTKLPGKYGEQLKPLDSYPRLIKKDYPKLYRLLGSEKKTAAICSDRTLPKLSELRSRIRLTGRRLTFPKLQMIVNGVIGELLLVENMR